jgi:hypothetical protein
LKYNEWFNELQKIHEETKGLLVDEEVMCESITIKDKFSISRRYSIFLGDEIRFNINGLSGSAYEFKKAYSSKNPDWQSMLGGLRTKVTMAKILNEKLLGAMVEPYLKEAVLDRLTGENEMPGNEEIIRKAAARRLVKLKLLLPKMDGQFRAEFPLPSPSENYTLQAKYRFGSVDVEYGNPTGLKCCWSFLLHYDEIVATVEKFAVVFKPVAELCGKSIRENDNE